MIIIIISNGRSGLRIYMFPLAAASTWVSKALLRHADPKFSSAFSITSAYIS